MGKFFDELKEGLEEAVEYQKGKVTLRTTSVELPEPPAQYTAKDIKRIRARDQYSQGIFAMILNVSPKTVQAWEAGERNPSHAALRLLEIVDKGIYHPTFQSNKGHTKTKYAAS